MHHIHCAAVILPSVSMQQQCEEESAGEVSYKTKVDVRQGCLLALILFRVQLFPEKIMQETFHDHCTSTSITMQPRFADDIELAQQLRRT